MTGLRRLVTCVLLLVTLIIALGCAAAEDDWERGSSAVENLSAGDSFDADARGATEEQREVMTAPLPTPMPQPTIMPPGMPDRDFADDAASESSQGSDGQGGDSITPETGFPSVSAQSRLIVRTVDMTMEVDDIAAGLESIGVAAVARGGWVVSEARHSRHNGWIAIRVPSAQLDDAVRAISALGVKVLSRSSTSQDVTEEYFDIQSRITNLNATLESLRQLLSREGELEDILNVQREITRVSGEIEVLEGRKRYLEQTSATSLINVNLELVAATMEVDAGPDLQAAQRRAVAFRATFRPPEDIEDFQYSWDFGDGAPPQTWTGTAQTENEGERITQTVRYTYESAEEAPYFVTFEIRGTGDAGVVRGEDAIKVDVLRVPTIHVSTPGSMTIRAGDDVTLTGAFTRPEDVTNLTYVWDFGDGLNPVSGVIEDDQNEITVTHEYTIERREAYYARFTVEGETSFGAPLTASSNTAVYVNPGSRWVVGFLDVGETARSATRTVSAVAQAIVVAAVWVVLVSPIWAPVIAGIWYLRRRMGGIPRPSGFLPRRRGRADAANTEPPPDTP